MQPHNQKIVIVTRPTQLAQLKRRFSTRSHAQFQIISAKRRELAATAAAVGAAMEKAAAAAFDDIDSAAQTYDSAVQTLRRDLYFEDFDLPVQTIDRDFLPNFLFGPADIIVTVGQDGLVANTAKYTVGRPIVAINPDPQRFDGILLPFRINQARDVVRSVLLGKAKFRQVTLAEAQLDNGQKLLAFNELFIGNKTHVSARYKLTVEKRSEPQSSSGLLVSTGAGSTGWLSSVFNMAAGVGALFGKTADKKSLQLSWDDPRLVFVVREPFASKTSQTNLVAGVVLPGHHLTIESDMASDGVIFSDGVESDNLEFNAGTTARIHASAGKSRLVVP